MTIDWLRQMEQDGQLDLLIFIVDEHESLAEQAPLKPAVLRFTREAAAAARRLLERRYGALEEPGSTR